MKDGERRVAREMVPAKRDAQASVPEFSSVGFDGVVERVAHGMPLGMACRESGLSRADLVRMMLENPELKERIREAQEEGIERIEWSARKRAMSGSDLLAMFILKAAKPDVYHDSAGANVVNIEIRWGGDVERPSHGKEDALDVD